MTATTQATETAGVLGPGQRVLGAGVIGLGNGRNHCEAYHQAAHANLVAVCDLVEERLAWARQKYGCATYTDVDALLAHPGLGVVSVAVPNHLHREVATKVLRAGKHCLLEKPMALTLEDCDAILAEAEQARLRFGTVLTIDKHYRHNPAVRELKRLIDAGAIGRPCAVSIYYWRGPFARNKPFGWNFDERKSGGMLVEEACWWFDCLAYLVGPLAEVSCLTADAIHPDFPYEDVAYANVRYQNGAVGHLTHSLAGSDTCTQFWVFGTEAALWGVDRPGNGMPFAGPGAEAWVGAVTLARHPRADQEKARLAQEARAQTRRFPPETRPGYRDLINHLSDFVQRLVAGRPPLVHPQEARAAVAASLAARASARRGGRPVGVGSVATPWE